LLRELARGALGLLPLLEADCGRDEERGGKEDAGQEVAWAAGQDAGAPGAGEGNLAGGYAMAVQGPLPGDLQARRGLRR
jgi:hypothetical protein